MVMSPAAATPAEVAEAERYRRLHIDGGSIHGRRIYRRGIYAGWVSAFLIRIISGRWRIRRIACGLVDGTSGKQGSGSNSEQNESMFHDGSWARFSS
jgi:hypothetical protein